MTIKPAVKKLPLSKEDARVREWLKKNWGVMQQVADQHKISKQSVSRIAYGRFSGHSRDWRIERALKALGCPNIKIG